jgi:hypothetical protein
LGRGKEGSKGTNLSPLFPPKNETSGRIDLASVDEELSQENTLGPMPMFAPKISGGSD